MLDVVGQCVLVRVAASVVRLAVAELALHLPATDAAQQEPADQVGTANPLPLSRRAAGTVLAADAARGLEVLDADQRLMSRVLRPHPLRLVIPAHPRLIAERHVADVEQDLVLALPV